MKILLLLGAHDVGQVLVLPLDQLIRKEASVPHHLLVVVEVSGLDVIQDVRVLGLQGSVQLRRLSQVRIASAQCPEGMLAVDAAAALGYHRVAHPVPSIRTSSVREQYLVNLQ